ncbi:putative feruloyl esterase [Heracleum sosnowskyi]|uniref:Feruloyl esterase n=1 Tax=Heracleum sosnowskyi TaxID=360622 RepID=A0AAD8GTE4_9APIA|nr:putative feruloyl esterase [Heracleum sosnowskyi]
MAMGAILNNFPSNIVITKKAAPLDYQILKQTSCYIVRPRNHKLHRTLNMAHSSSTHFEQTPEKQHQRVIVQNNYGEKLVGVLRESGTMEIVVLCHGFRSTKESSTIASLAAALEKEGISVFSFDFAGNGESEGTFEYGNYRREADDLCAVIKHLNGMKRVVTAIVGHSKGGDVVLVYASKYHDINRVVNVSGRYNLERGIEDRLGKDFLQVIQKDGFIDVKTKGDTYLVTKESLMERLNTNMHEACLNIDNTCRVLTVHGSDDEVIPVEDAIEFDKIIPNHKLHIVEGANHSYTSHQAELASVVVPFIKDGVEHKDA